VTSISMLTNAAPTQRLTPPPNGIHAGGFGTPPTNRSGLNDAASGKLSSDSSTSRILNTRVVFSGMTQSRKRIRALVVRMVASRTGRIRCTSEIVACRNSDPPASTSSVSRDSSCGWRVNRSTAQPSDPAVVS
jgi:hypothetical protein